ncbi:MAG: cadmium-translocating P-type ATPase [Oscillospiraceae bacterium]|nr:cadmium-translocating P-type ATPase [Oscillospiraceae bacterium]
MTRKQKRTLWRIVAAAVLCIVIALLPVEGLWRGLLFAIPYLIVGYDVLWSAIRNILHGQVFDEKFLMAIATLGAFAIREYPEAAAVMLFYQIGELFQGIAVGRSRRSIAALMDIAPESAVVLRDGQEEEVSPDEVQVGETILVRPGEKIPLDGVILEGCTTVNTAALTGESLPADKAEGERVVSGSINLTGLIKVRTESVYEDSTVAKILELVENSQEKKAHVESFITRFARWYTPCVVIGALLLALIPPLLLGQPWAVWVKRALIFLVVSCPCALVVSVPLSFFGGIGGASREGILIKGANYLETLAKVDTVVFDKTGTLTQGSFAVDAIHPTQIDAQALLDIAAAAESYSQHPVAESIVAAHGGDIDHSRIGQVTEIAGKGLRAEVDGQTFYVGNSALMEQIGADYHDCHLVGTVIHVAREQEYLGHIVISDQLKPDAAQAVADLKVLGVRKTVMLTGDIQKVAQAVAEKLGVDEVHAGLLPGQKVEQVEHMLQGGAKLAFVGDGINDAPVLTRADVGIAMGAMGSDAAIESADIVLMDDKPSRLPLAVKLSRRTMRIVNENIVFALAVKAVILLLGALGIANMWFAVFGDVGVLILAVLNAMRCLGKVE